VIIHCSTDWYAVLLRKCIWSFTLLYTHDLVTGRNNHRQLCTSDTIERHSPHPVDLWLGKTIAKVGKYIQRIELSLHLP
jgi:hypothetical protein